MVPHMVPISWRQIKSRIPLDLARLQATNEPCHVGSEHCWVLQVWSEVQASLAAQSARYTFPRIRAMPVSEVTTADILAILTPIWHEKSQTARRVRQRIGGVMKCAVAMGHRPDNPPGDALGRQQAVVQHMRALPHGAVADALATVRASQASVTTKRAFEFLVLTAARSGEVRLATWDEMDLDAGVCTIPSVRMKTKRDHRVLLSGRALAILHDVQRLTDGTGLVFRSLRGKSLSNMTLSKLIKELGIAAVPHGFRSSFRDWAAERRKQRVCSLPHRRRVGLVRRGAGVHRLSPDADGCGSWRLVDATAAEVQERLRQVLLDGTLVRD